MISIIPFLNDSHYSFFKIKYNIYDIFKNGWIQNINNSNFLYFDEDIIWSFGATGGQLFIYYNYVFTINYLEIHKMT